MSLNYNKLRFRVEYRWIRSDTNLKQLILFVLMVMLTSHATAVVVNQSAAGFLVRNVAVVTAVPEKVYDTLMNEIGNWWDPAHTFSGDAHNLSVENRVGGCFCEHFPGGGGVRHLTIVNMIPAKRLRLAGGLGPLQSGGISGSLTWDLAETGEDTTVTLEYSVGGYLPDGLQNMAEPVDGMLNSQLQRLKSYIEHGRPAPE